MNKIALAPISLRNTPALEYINAAMQAGYDGIGIRLFRSPGVQYAFHPVVGDQGLMRDVKSAIASATLEVLDVLSFYLQPKMDLDSMLAPLAFGAEIGAKYALVTAMPLNGRAWSTTSAASATLQPSGEPQLILAFDAPQTLSTISLEVEEPEVSRTKCCTCPSPVMGARPIRSCGDTSTRVVRRARHLSARSGRSRLTGSPTSNW